MILHIKTPGVFAVLQKTHPSKIFDYLRLRKKPLAQ